MERTNALMQSINPKWQAFKTSYKTSLLGIGAASLNLYANGASNKQVAVSLGIALLGLMAKDNDVSHKPAEGSAASAVLPAAAVAVEILRQVSASAPAQPATK